MRAYHQAAATLNLLRAFAGGGYASLERVAAWNLGFASDSPQADRYLKMAGRVQDAVDFMAATGVNSDNAHPLRGVSYYTSHEALLLFIRGGGVGGWVRKPASALRQITGSGQPDAETPAPDAAQKE